MFFLDELNPQQREAVLYTEAPLLVLAGAGSGKTRVITYKIAYLVKELDVPEDSILGVTFTNKAAGEMKSRVAKLLQKEVTDVWLGTFHATAVKILRRYGPYVGINNNFSILDEDDQTTLIKEVISELNLDIKRYPPGGFIERISRAKESLIDPVTYGEFVESYYESVVAKVYQKYQEKLIQNQALDFDDLLMYLVKLFRENEKILSYYQNKFRYILVDEYQDTNYAQYVIVFLLAQMHRRVTVVGDDDQAIYSWRGADIRNILEFEKDFPGAKVIRLEQNYRSTQNILEAANKVIAHNKFRKGKNLWTNNGIGSKIKLYIAKDEIAEANFVAREIILLQKKENLNFGDFAVFYRTHAQSRALEEAMIKNGIPYRIIGGIKFYQRKEIKDILSYLRFLVNQYDGISLKRIINTPRRGIGDATISKIIDYANEKGIDYLEAMKNLIEAGELGKKVGKEVEKFIELIEALIAYAKLHSIEDTIIEVLDKTGYIKELSELQTATAQMRIENVEELISVAKEFSKQAEDLTLESFLNYVSLMSDIDTLEEENSSVVLMTIHSAKGLEFPVVFMTGMEEGVFPHSLSMGEREELEEERRLCYVGMTRAKKYLYLTSAEIRTLYGHTNSNELSRFVKEIPEEYIEPVTKVDVIFERGERVWHSRWGEGIIQEVRPLENGETELVVVFNDIGKKHLLAKYAGLEKL
ncbi:MAG: UvrD-helicase domain-containing protein [bacterium]|nr:UvrD-helicase domain-containing protein [bacterium]